MALTEFGKEIRKARIDVNASLGSMADALNTTAAFLSAMETGRKKIPDQWVAAIENYFAQRGRALPDLRVLADVANKTVSLEGLSPAQQLAVAGLARRNVDDAQLQKFRELLGM